MPIDLTLDPTPRCPAGPFKACPTPDAPPMPRLERDTLDLGTSWPARQTTPAFSIQSIDYHDNMTGADASMVLGPDPGQLVAPIYQPPPPVGINPLTGQSDLELRNARLRLNAGRYDMMLSVDGQGRPHLGQVYMDGRAVPELVRDAFRRRLEDDPTTWGMVAAAAVAGAGTLASQEARRSGKPVDFDLGRFKLAGSDHYDVKVKPLGEFAGGSGRLGVGGAAVGLSYHDGPTVASLEAGEVQGKARASLGASYVVNPTAVWTASATYDERTHASGARIAFNARF